MKTAKPLPNQNAKPAGGRFPKTDSRYWLSRIFKPVNDRGQESVNYSMRVSYKGRRLAFTLDVGEKELAARKAADIYLNIVKHGVDATLIKQRPQAPEKPVSVATVGEYIAAAEKVFSGEPRTFGGYALALRRIAGDMQGTLKTSKRFKPGGKTDYRRKVDIVPLDVLTPERIQAWRLAHVAKAGKNPAAQKSARTTANSLLRQARSLFGKRITRYITGLNLPQPLPFSSVEFFPRESMKYQSKIDPAKLLQKATSELQIAVPDAYIALLLALGCGLRRGEIDRLLWGQVDFDKGVIHLEVTEAGGLKSADSQADVAIDATMVGMLRGFHALATGAHVLTGGNSEESSRKWGHRYRADGTFEKLNAWLRENGVDTRTPLHTLRKEAGSLIATAHGIHAASKFLRHHDIGITAAVYADHKERVTIPMGSFLKPENVIELEQPIAEPTEKLPTKTKRHAR